MFTQILRAPLDLNNEDEGEKLMKYKGWVTEKHERVAESPIASDTHNNENGPEYCFFHLMTFSQNTPGV